MSQPAVLARPDRSATEIPTQLPESAVVDVISEDGVETETDVRLRVAHHAGDAIVVHVRGSLDACTTPRLASLLTPRLECAASVLVLDLAGVEFVGTEALELLVQARLRAVSRGLVFRVVDGPRCLDRVLHLAQATGAEPFTTYPTVPAALADTAMSDVRDVGAPR